MDLIIKPQIMVCQISVDFHNKLGFNYYTNEVKQDIIRLLMNFRFGCPRKDSRFLNLSLDYLQIAYQVSISP